MIRLVTIDLTAEVRRENGYRYGPVSPLLQMRTTNVPSSDAGNVRRPEDLLDMETIKDEAKGHVG